MFVEYEIYGTSMCKWCEEAKDLLTKRGLKFKFFNIEIPEHLEGFKELCPGKRTVPQILGWDFEGEVHYDGGIPYQDMFSTHIGGYDELKSLLK